MSKGVDLILGIAAAVDPHDTNGMKIIITTAKKNVTEHKVKLGEFHVKMAEMNLDILQLQVEERKKENKKDLYSNESKVNVHLNSNLTKSISDNSSLDTSAEMMIAKAQKDIIKRKIELAEYCVKDAEGCINVLETRLMKNEEINSAVTTKIDIPSTNDVCLCLKPKIFLDNLGYIKNFCKRYKHDRTVIESRLKYYAESISDTSTRDQLTEKEYDKRVTLVDIYNIMPK